MTRQTAKRRAADAKAKELGWLSKAESNEQLYTSLDGLGYIWDPTKGVWEKGSKSMFTDSDGDPSGVIRLRVMGHPDDIDEAVELIRKQVARARLIEVSEKYSNRKGAGARVYCTLVLD